MNEIRIHSGLDTMPYLFMLKIYNGSIRSKQSSILFFGLFAYFYQELKIVQLTVAEEGLLL